MSPDHRHLRPGSNSAYRQPSSVNITSPIPTPTFIIIIVPSAAADPVTGQGGLDLDQAALDVGGGGQADRPGGGTCPNKQTGSGPGQGRTGARKAQRTGRDRSSGQGPAGRQAGPRAAPRNPGPLIIIINPHSVCAPDGPGTGGTVVTVY